jgi:hypothetical protein
LSTPAPPPPAIAWTTSRESVGRGNAGVGPVPTAYGDARVDL